MRFLTMFIAAILAFVASTVPAFAVGWADGVTTATGTLSADLLAVGAILLGLVCLIYGFRVVKGMLGR